MDTERIATFTLTSSLTILALSLSTAAGMETCTAGQQRSILPTVLNCEPRETTVPLELNNETFVHIIPGHVRVNRCGGSCDGRYHSCVAGTTRIKEVDVLLFPQTSAAGSVPSECATARVEEHVTCRCGCATTAEQCGALQTFLPSECRCACANESERAQCLRKGWHWNEALCQCMCRDPTDIPRCPSGYQFDPFGSCSCVNYAEYASTMIELLILVLVTALAFTSVGLAQCYKSKRGLFAESEDSEPSAGALASGRPPLAAGNAVELRTLFRALSSGSNTANFLARNRHPSGYEHIDETKKVPSVDEPANEALLAAAMAAQSAAAIVIKRVRTASLSSSGAPAANLEPLLEER